eukprot:TRINITY_DN10169_c0_g1_i1.p1 TRINITY_DN10169_c0_g1~~TRINITY_DN10169_c0_g1_i1.p1  ORF type:complete len:324 (+),score=88.38 TRINITY_DN10169_c0_g1_i1:79-972(+)
MPARRAAAGDQAGPRAGAARKADAAAAPRAKRRRVGAPAAAAKLGSPQNESRGAVRFTAPTGWEPLWDAVAAMRAKGGAPVDGCDDIADKTQGEDVRRYQVLVALMLSSQTRDEQTAAAMSRLRQEGLTPRKISRTSEARLRELIKNVSFYNNKAKYIKAATDILLAEYGGGTPRSVEQCVRLPGVGPKMAHLFVQSAWGRTEGVGVDVHVHRICNRWGWAESDTPEGTRLQLEAWLPKERWQPIAPMLAGLGQTICTARNTKCGECAAAKLCRNAWKEASAADRKRRRAADIEDLP